MKRINKTFLMKRLWKQVGVDLLAATKETVIVIKESASELLAVNKNTTFWPPKIQHLATIKIGN